MMLINVQILQHYLVFMFWTLHTQCPPGPGSLTITKQVTCDDSVQNKSICTAAISNSQYPTIVLGTNPNPGFFNIGNQQVQVVSLSPGEYFVKEVNLESSTPTMF